MDHNNRTIYLTDLALSESELYRKFDSDYDIPVKISGIYYGSICNNLCDGHIKYICPDCTAELKAEWRFINKDKIENRVIKDQTYDFATSKMVPCYKMYHVTNSGSISSRTSILHDFTDQDYEDHQRIMQRLEATFSDYSKKTHAEIRYAAELSHCPVCGAKLIKKYPFTEFKAEFSPYASGHLPEYMEKWFDWAKEVQRSHPWRRWDRSTAEAYERQGKSFAHFSREVQAEEFGKVFDAPALEKHGQFIQMCDTVVPNKSITADKSVDLLKGYLLNLINLESNIMCMSKRLEQLYLLAEKNNRDITFEQNFLLYHATREIEQKDQELLALKQERKAFADKPLVFAAAACPPRPAKPEMLKASVFNKKKIELLNAQAMEAYCKAMEAHNSAVEKCRIQTESNKAAAQKQKDAELERYDETIERSTSELMNAQSILNARKDDNKSIPTKAVGAKQIIYAEIASVEEALKNTFRCRNELYSYNIVFEKYRNIVALSSFYEYLMAGRCDCLEGPNGAYNIYVNESRMASIMIKLDEIKTKLDEIKENQFMIYNKMKAMESSLSQLNHSMEKALSSLEAINANTTTMIEHLETISRNTEVIAHNTVVSAYYSKVNTELTNALGFMAALH